MNPYVLLGGLVALIAAFGGGYYQGHTNGTDKCVAEQARDERVAQIAGVAAADVAASAISGIKVNNTTIKQEVQREIVETVSYRECVHPDGVLRNINAALTGNPTPAASSVVPASNPSVGGDVR